ncbi:PRC protein [Sulfitobacter noctilucicola]|uniref:Ribosomal 30S subunit maturation factor RimM n=1 Tax=Sulfitobacter noctilucicola TaxID=1342301 RepID=A0A7W6M9A9_9RHOB|nr:PRC-barrel domain-containing protein [Sulfitobacter noctilucicola]KIN63681.1 PRC protein [Sulfitobacter noctilucicola]MBB4174810.1 ribosomal 30S subunit maturation factor RimM [Sulfitobacter noctilucicola]
MKRFLSTTAVLVALAGTAYADAHSNSFGAVTFEKSDFFASDLIGMRIYNAETEMETGATIEADAEKEWDDIGEINDIIVGKDGEVRAVILGVGGFLGMGERDVSVSMDAIKVVQEDGDAGDRFLVVTTSKEMLEQAPEFERGDDEMASGSMANDNMTNTTETEATDTTETDAAEDVNTASNMEATDDDLARPAMTYDGYADAEAAEVEQLTAELIEGSYVYGAQDETVGEIDTLVMSDDGKVTDVVINVGGFLGLGEKPVAVSFDKIQVLKNVDGDDYRFYIDSTKEKLEALPEYDN